MFKITLAFLFLALIAFLSLTPVRADEGDDMVVDDDEPDSYDEDFEDDDVVDDKEEWDGITLVPNDDIVSTIKFLEYSDMRFPLSKEVTMLVGLHNTGEEMFKVAGVKAFIQSPFDLSYHIQNFTGKPLNVALGPGEQATLEYTFMPDPTLEPLSYWFSAFVFINATDRIYRQVPVNETVTLTTEEQSMDLLDVLTYVMSMVMASGIAYAVRSNMPKSKTRRTTRSKKVSSKDGNDGWDQTAYTQSKSSKVVSKRSGIKTRSKN